MEATVAMAAMAVAWAGSEAMAVPAPWGRGRWRGRQGGCDGEGAAEAAMVVEEAAVGDRGGGGR